jgi:hypothetical protein
MMRAALAASALALAATAWAQGTARSELMQKAFFTKRLLEASPPAATTEGAAAMYARALEHLERGEEHEAESRLNEAIRSLQLARRPSDGGARYAALLSSVQTMRETYLRYAAQVEDPHGTLIAEVDQALASARELQRNAPQDAVRTLARAEQALTAALTQALGSLTVSYAPSFSGPQEEFGFEQARHRAYAALVPAALNELQPGPAARTLVQRHVDSGDALAARALREAELGDWRAALASVRDATAQLQRALGAAGLAVSEESQ